MEFPQPEPSDNDDVAWAIQTANTMYKRGDHAEAIRWLQRAADAAEEAGDDVRLLSLARAAAEFANPRAASTRPPPAAPPAPNRNRSVPPAAAGPSAGPPAPQASAPPPKRSKPPAPKRSAPPPPPVRAPQEVALEDVMAPPSAPKSAPPPAPAAPIAGGTHDRVTRPVAADVHDRVTRPMEATPEPPPARVSPAIEPATAARLDGVSATSTPTAEIDRTTRQRLEGLSATATPTRPAIPKRLSRPSDSGEEVTHVFQDPRRENAKAKTAGASPAAATPIAQRTPLPLKRPFMSSVTNVNRVTAERAAPPTQAIHDSSPVPHRTLRVCVLRATSPGTFLVRPLAPGEPLPPNGREALLVPLDPEDDFSH